MQRGQVFKISGSWYLRYYRDELKDGKPVRRRVCEKLARYSDDYRSRRDLQPLIDPVPLIPIVRAALDAHRKLHPGDGYIFAGERNGTPLHLDNLSRRVIRPALNGAWKGWHGFRRGLATNLYRLGVQDKVIQEILRHANLATTQENYIIIDHAQTRAMKKLERAVGKEWAKAAERQAAK